MKVNLRRRPAPSTYRRKVREMRELFPDLVNLIPEGRSGNVEIRHGRMTREACEEQWLTHGWLVTPHPYVQLNIDGVGWMHDILEERLKNREVVRRAHGDVLIGGLGLGMILHPILAKPEVRSVRVLENNPHVVQLVLPSLDGIPGREKLTLEMADAATWEPPAGVQFDTIWLDCIAWYANHTMFIRVVERWLNHYQPFLRDTPTAWLHHWAFEEAVQELQRRNDWLEIPLGEVKGNSQAALAEALALAPRELLALPAGGAP